MSAITRYGSRASGEAISIEAARPFTIVNAPPRDFATRSGYANAKIKPACASSPSPRAPPARRAMRSANARAASARAPRSPANRCKRSRTSALRPPRPCSVSTMAMRAPSKASPRRPASITMCANRGESGRRATARPCSVKCPSPSSAPMRFSNAIASAHAGLGGGSSHANAPGSLAPQAARSSARPERSASRISGRSNSGNERVSPSLHKRQHTPGSSLPARPARCVIEAWLARTVSNRDNPSAGSNRGRRAKPASTTMRTPSIVKLVSAIEVANTTLRRPAGEGAIAASWSAGPIAPYSGRISTLGSPMLARKTSAVRSISRTPGKNTSALPRSALSALRTAAATSSSTRAATARGRYTCATGNIRPSLTITGASPSNAAIRAASKVADITTSFRSGRSAPCVSRANANPRSPSRLRS